MVINRRIGLALTMVFLLTGSSMGEDWSGIGRTHRPRDLIVCEAFSRHDWCGGAVTDLHLRRDGQEDNVLRDAMRSCLRNQTKGALTESLEDAHEIVDHVSGRNNHYSFAGEEIVAGLLLAGMAAHESEEYRFAHKCYRSAGNLISNDTGAPILTVSLMYASATTFAAEQRFSEAFSVATKARKTMSQLRHDFPALFCLVSSLEIVLSHADKNAPQIDSIDLTEFSRPRAIRLGIANAHVLLASQIAVGDTIQEAVKSASHLAEQTLGSDHEATIHLREIVSGRTGTPNRR